MIIDSPVISGSAAASFRNVAVTGSLGVTGSITTTGTITAQTLVVQTITSSISRITGSTQFGSSSINTHQFTGSLLVSGSATFDGQFSSPVTFNGPGSNWAAVIQNTNSTAGTSYGLRLKAGTSTGADATLVLQDYAGNEYLTARGNGKISIGGTNSPVTTLHVSGSSDTLGRVVRFNNSFNSASIDISHASNGGSLGFANSGSGNLSNIFFVTTGAGTIGSGIVMNNAGHVGFATSNVTESVQAAGTVSIITNSSVSSGPLIQLAGNGRIRPATGGDRLSIDGNSLYLNAYVGGNIITNTAGGGFSIGRSDVPSTFNVSGSTNGSTPVVDIRASGVGSWLRGVRQLNSGMTAGSSMMYAVGQADSARNMGQFYFYYAGDGSTNNRLGIGLHSVDDVMNIMGSNTIVMGSTYNYSDTRLSVVGQTADSSAYSFIAKSSTPNDLFIVRNDGTIFFPKYGIGTVALSSGGTMYTSSDKNLKIDDGTIDSALNKVMQLNPRYFYWKEETDLGPDRQLGFYAQDINEVLGSEVANKNSADKWGIYDRGIMAYLTKAIQELKSQNDSLQSQIDELKNK